MAGEDGKPDAQFFQLLSGLLQQEEHGGGGNTDHCIKPGWKTGTKITFEEKGNVEPNVIPADLVFIIDEKPHNVFTREGNDLIMRQKISLVEALTGYTVNLTTLDGRSLTIPVNRVIHQSHEEVVAGEGTPLQKEPSKRGNLRIKFDVKFPTRLTAEQKAGIKKLLAY